MVNDEALDVILRKARSHNVFSGEVTDAQLRALWDLVKCGPTTGNSQPVRILFLRSRAQKERLRPHLSPSNVDKALNAPVTALLAYDLAFYELLPRFFPRNPAMKNMYAGEEKKAFTETTALRNSSLQGGYFILAARALGLDIGAMSGFNNAGVDQEFFAGTTLKSNFLCALGKADWSKTHPRDTRLEFEEACQIL